MLRALNQNITLNHTIQYISNDNTNYEKIGMIILIFAISACFFAGFMCVKKVQYTRIYPNS